MTLGVNAEFIIENQSGQCCKPAVQFTDFTPTVTITGSAYSSTTKSYSQTISSDSQVYLLTDFTNSTSHMNVSLGKTDQTYFSVSQFEKAGSLTAFEGQVLKCGNHSGYCYSESLAVGPNAEGSTIGDGWMLSTATDSGGLDYLIYRWENGKWVRHSGIRSDDRRFPHGQSLGCQPSRERSITTTEARGWGTQRVRHVDCGRTQRLRFHVRRSLDHRMRRSGTARTAASTNCKVRNG